MNGQGGDKTAIRHAATTIVLRGRGADARVLMGMRGAAAAFMPEKFVFPGGAVDIADREVADIMLDPTDYRRLGEGCADPALVPAVAAAAIRELWEETGLILGRPGEWRAPPPEGWQGFAASGHVPTAEAMTFVFRAITPAGRPRRFDARFFLVDADHLASDPDDFSAACDELSDLQWIPVAEARSFNLPFITEVVLAEVSRMAEVGGKPASVPFFDNSGPRPQFLRLD